MAVFKGRLVLNSVFAELTPYPSLRNDFIYAIEPQEERGMLFQNSLG
jgi:hypothetical protein